MNEPRTFRELVEQRFGGVLKYGSHPVGKDACVQEALSVWEGIPWTDSPILLNVPDVRSLNDSPWPSDAARTEALVPLIEALMDWKDWGQDKQQHWIEQVIFRSCREILSPLFRELKLLEEADALDNATSMVQVNRAAEAAKAAAKSAAWAVEAAEAAKAAVWAAAGAARAAAWAVEAAEAAKAAARAAEAARAAAWAAEAARAAAAWAADAARAAAGAAAGAAGSSYLELACRIWIEEAHNQENQILAKKEEKDVYSITPAN